MVVKAVLTSTERSKLYCDGFAQSNKLWRQKTPTLGKAQTTIKEYPLLGNGPVNAYRGNEYATIL